MRLLPECDLVVSATASPNYTLTAEGVREAGLTHPVLLVDLAVPRDIDPLVEKLPFVKRYDIDDFHVDAQSDDLKENIRKAERILEEQMEEFYVWYECHDMIPKIQGIKESAAMDLELRLTKILRALPLEEGEREALRGQIDAAAAKVVNKMMFGLRDAVSQKTFRECVEGLEKVYEE